MGDLSDHFSTWEFTDHITGALIGPDPELVRVLECIRALSGRPLPVVSGYRSRATNRLVGGAENSQHLYGRAADIPPGRCRTNEAIHCGARGIGVDRLGWVVHVDTRPGPVIEFPDT